MSGAEALEEIRRLAMVPWRIVWTGHAEERMDLRGATRSDVVRALLSSNEAAWQTDHQSWKVSGGVDTAGDELTIAITIDDDLVIRTVF